MVSWTSNDVTANRTEGTTSTGTEQNAGIDPHRKPENWLEDGAAIGALYKGGSQLSPIFFRIWISDGTPWHMYFGMHSFPLKAASRPAGTAVHQLVHVLQLHSPTGHGGADGARGQV